MDSLDAFKRTVDDRYRIFKATLDELISTYATQDVTAASEKARKVAEAGHQLTAILSDLDQPEWLKNLTRSARGFSAKVTETEATSLLRSIVNIYGT